MMSPLPPQVPGKTASLLLAVLLLLAQALSACTPSDEPDLSLGDEVPAPWRPVPLIPETNPLTPEKAELGRWLFYDRRLSADGSISCATCHRPELAFTDGLKNSPGIHGDLHPLNTPGLTNSVFQPRLNWANPHTKTFEDQLRGPLFGEGAAIIEMGLTTPEIQQQVLDTLRNAPEYQPLWQAAWPDAPATPGNTSWTWDRIIQSLASFLSTLISDDSPWDRYQRGDKTALSPAQVRGARLFFSHENGIACHHCHGGFTFTSVARHAGNPFDETAFFNIGLYNIDDDGSYPPGSEGLFAHTGDPADKGAFRAPTLRNLRWTAPYMHDGSIATLREVIEHYQDGGRNITHGPNTGDGRLNINKDLAISGMRLTDTQIQDLEAFLDALSDESFVNNPTFHVPPTANPQFFGP